MKYIYVLPSLHSTCACTSTSTPYPTNAPTGIQGLPVGSAVATSPVVFPRYPSEADSAARHDCTRLAIQPPPPKTAAGGQSVSVSASEPPSCHDQNVQTVVQNNHTRLAVSYERLLLPAKCQPNYTNRTLPWTLVSVLSSHHLITVHSHPDQPWIRSLPPGHVLSTGQRVRAPDGLE